MIDTIRKVFRLLIRPEKKRFFLVLFLNLFTSILEVIGITSIFPFISIAMNPDMIHSNEYLSILYTHLNFSSEKAFLVTAGFGVFLLLLISNAAKAFGNWNMHRFAAACTNGISTRLFTHYIYQPYHFFLNRNSSELSKNVLSEARAVVGSFISPTILIITRTFITLLLFTMLIIANPIASILMTSLLGGLYILVYFGFRKTIVRIGEEKILAQRDCYRTTYEAFGGIKDIKLLNREPIYIRSYSDPMSRYAEYDAKNAIIGNVPKYIIEGLAFGLIILLMVFLILTSENAAAAFPLISLYAFAAYRMLPALQEIFQSFSKIRYSLPLGRLVSKELSSGEKPVVRKKTEPALPFDNKISLNEIVFYYPNTMDPVIRKVSLNIKKNTTIGFVGATGSGKTTMVDIILGLLVPQTGKFLVDDTIISNENRHRWQQNIGYVSQHIYLSDDSVRKNIAFGIPEDEINQEAVEKAAKIAQIHSFIMEEMSEGYDSIVGDRGIRISGGQRQRMGIARALYTNPEVLVLDEATSALDNLTEQSIMNAINQLSHKKTIIMIAHRLSTVKSCDEIFFFKKGKILDSGNFKHLYDNNEEFRNLASYRET